LADGYFVLPYTIGNYLADEIHTKRMTTEEPEFVEAASLVEERLNKIMAIQGSQSVDTIHKKLGKVMWEYCGMARNKEGLEKGLAEIPKLKEAFWNDVRVTGKLDEFNPEIEKASRLADFLELAELMMHDAIERKESCGGHFREEMATAEGEAKRDDTHFAHVAAWHYNGDQQPVKHVEPLIFESVELKQRDYK
jgi:succinate dehydrogenase / fumarate reductase flavoprotein subunit